MSTSMRSRHRPLGLAALLVVLLLAAAACSSAHAATDHASTGQAVADHANPGAEPSDSAKMVCGSEIRTSIATALSLPQRPAPTSTWVDDLFTCTYTLPDGPLVLSVKALSDDAGAERFFTQTSKELGPGQSLGRVGFQSNDGVVLFAKDNKVLEVDARRLPDKLGPDGVSKNDFAYQLSTNVLGCWTG